VRSFADVTRDDVEPRGEKQSTVEFPVRHRFVSGEARRRPVGAADLITNTPNRKRVYQGYQALRDDGRAGGHNLL
jgi:hypothetical protein